MIRLFRQLRQGLLRDGKTREYLRYAMGEIALVIIGILLALQVNNWNEERLEQRQVSRYAHALAEDLEQDINMLEPLIRQIHASMAKIEALNAYTQNRSLQDLDNLDLFQLTSLVGYRAFEWHRGSFEQMQAAGALQEMRNFELANKISAYQALTRHLDQDFSQDNDCSSEASRAADLVVDAGYEFNDRLKALLRNSSSAPLRVPDPELHAIYADTRLQLLTDDIRQVRIMSNKFQACGGMQVRADSELPKAIAQAREIIALLRKEYPE